MTIELESLVGEHVLSGAFFDSAKEPSYKGSDWMEDKQVLRFTLNGRNLEAVEDPDDGYRSSLGDLRPSSIAPANQFPPVKVVGQMKTKGEYGGEDCILQFLNAATGKPIIEIGTSDVDDYYPGFVGYFSPENLVAITAK